MSQAITVIHQVVQAQKMVILAIILWVNLVILSVNITIQAYNLSIHRGHEAIRLSRVDQPI